MKCDHEAECEHIKLLHLADGAMEIEASILLAFVAKVLGRPGLTYTEAASLDLGEADAIRRDHEAVSHLPKSADGAPVVPGMELWSLDTERYGDEYHVESGRLWHGQVTGMEIDDDSALVTLTLDEFGGYVECWLANCYSTRTAAEAAKGKHP